MRLGQSLEKRHHTVAFFFAERALTRTSARACASTSLRERAAALAHALAQVFCAASLLRIAFGFSFGFTLLVAPHAAAQKLIALDVGHSLSSPGAISARGRAEFEFNRDLVEQVRRKLNAAGYRTIVIGAEGDETVLAARPRKAKGADLFISFHHDSAKERFLQRWTVDGVERFYLDDRFKGFSLFVSRENPQLEQSLRCASMLGNALSMQLFKPSLYHADSYLGESRSFADEANGVHYFDTLAVLRRATMPAVLLEAGVILNRDEELAMRELGTQLRIAEAVVEAVNRCLP
jgi:N-acetylmuramoyl-L-alanine amidase